MFMIVLMFHFAASANDYSQRFTAEEELNPEPSPRKRPTESVNLVVLGSITLAAIVGSVVVVVGATYVHRRRFPEGNHVMPLTDAEEA
jgi:hypothetical protein